MVRIATFSMQIACFFAKKCAKMGLLILYFIFRITVEIRTRFWMTHFCPCIVNRLVNRSTIYCGDFLAKIKNSSIQNSATPKPCILNDFGRRRTQIYRNKSRTNAAESAIRQGFGAGSDYYCYPSRTGVEPNCPTTMHFRIFRRAFARKISI